MEANQAELVKQLKAAIKDEDPDKIRSLVEAGVELNAEYPEILDKDAPTPLEYAINYDRRRVVGCLLDMGADPYLNYWNLMRKAFYKPEILQVLITHNIDVNKRSKWHEFTLLHYIAECPGDIYGNLEECKFIRALDLLIRKGGAKVNAQDDKGLTPLHICMELLNSTEFMDVLIHRYGAAADLPDNRGYTPWDYAISEEDKALRFGVLELLVKSGMDLNRRIRGDWTYLHDMVVVYPRERFALEYRLKLKQKIIELVHLMLAHGAEVDPIGGPAAITPLGYLVTNSMQCHMTAMDIIKILIDAGADPCRKVGPNRDVPLPIRVIRSEHGNVDPEVQEFFKQFL